MYKNVIKNKAVFQTFIGKTEKIMLNSTSNKVNITDSEIRFLSILGSKCTDHREIKMSGR